MALALDAHVDRDGDEPMSLVTLDQMQTGLPFALTAMLLVGIDGLLPGDNNLYLLSEVTDATIPPVVDPETGVSAIERVPSGQLDEDLLLSPCDEYVLAFRGDDKVRVATPCIGLATNGIGGDADFGRIPPEIADLTTIAVELPGLSTKRSWSISTTTATSTCWPRRSRAARQHGQPTGPSTSSRLPTRLLRWWRSRTRS